LEDAKGSPETLSITRRALTLSRDHELARRAGVTAKVHVRHILEKLGVRDRIQAILLGQELLEGDLN
jgi:hypothetical protein